MKKQTLLGAAALTTLALAGAAHAGTLSPHATSVVAGAVKQNRVIATEATAASLSGVVALALTPSADAILPSGNAILKITLDGGATFGTAVTSAAITGDGVSCAPTVTPSAGGGKDDSSVTFLVSTLNGCKGAVTAPAAAASPILITVPVKLNGTANVNVSTDLRTEAGTPIDGATASTFKAATASAAAVNLFSFAPAFALKVTPATTGDIKAQLSDFKVLSGSALGKAEVTVTPGAFSGIGASSTTAISAADVTSVKYTVKGSQTTVDLSAKVGAGGAALIPTGIVTGTGADVVEFTVAAKAVPVAAVASTYTVAADLVLSAGFATQPTYAAQSLRSVVRDGASYLVPWVASGTLATSSTSNTVIRIANIGAKTGPVSLELLTSSAGTPASTTLIPVAASIAKGGEVVLTSGQIETLVGANFARGDVRLTVEALPGDLIVRRFVQSTVNGALSEVSLGRSIPTATNGGSEPVN